MQTNRDDSTTDAPRVLVGICSCRANREKREAVRETWLSRPVPGVECRFFIGGGTISPDGEPDVVVLPVNDDYDHLPSKVRAFFAEALATSDFDWLFKCDDDTYVALERLHGLIDGVHELVGNEFIQSRGSPSGGAGYLLSRRMVRILADDPSLPGTGAEDVAIGQAAIRHGASAIGLPSLCWDRSRSPLPDNHIVTSHWCTPEQLRAVDSMLHERPAEIEAVHPVWRDRLRLYPSGIFVRCSTSCRGRWSKGEGGVLHLKWTDWGAETFVPMDESHIRGAGTAQAGGNMPIYQLLTNTGAMTVVVNLTGGIGNQMFQYAHGLALARRMGAVLKLAFVNAGRPFAMDIFGLVLDGEVDPTGALIEDWGPYKPDAEWPTLAACRSAARQTVRIAGYFQNEGFFLPVADELRFRLRLDPMRPPAISGRTPVCLHVRRGDYVGSPMHDLCALGYYLDAVRVMRSLVRNPVFLVLSDDPEWCRGRFTLLPDAVVVEALTVRDTLRTMYACKGFILSNSTFGWWGAWIADSGPVIVPDRFLRSGNWEVCPSRWIRLPAEGLKLVPVKKAAPAAVGPLRLISFSLYGSNDLYCIGLLDNVRVAPEVYPGWHAVVFHDGSVPSAILELAREGGATTVYVRSARAPMAMRFLAATLPGIERVVFRDADSILGIREREAVDEWIASGLPFHSMRDHPSHTMPIMGGMWGCTGGSLPGLRTKIRRYPWTHEYGEDQRFLEDHVWNERHAHFLVHDSHGSGPLGKMFPTPRRGRGFVGERVVRGQPVFDTWRRLKDIGPL